MYATHGTARKSRRSAPTAGRGRPVARTAYAPSGDMSDYVNQMQSMRSDLLTRRDAIDHQISVLDNAMEAFDNGGSVRHQPSQKSRIGRISARRLDRPAGETSRTGSLRNMVVKVLSSRSIPMSPNQISDAVKKAGYKTKAKDLSKAVSNVLPEIGSVKRVGFGKYAI